MLVGRCVSLGEEIFPYAPSPSCSATWWRAPEPTPSRDWAGPASPELARLVPALRPGDGPRPPRRPPASVSRLFQACCSLFDAISRERPLVLVIEDLHWADRSTRELLVSARAPAARRDPALLTLRTDEAPAGPRASSGSTAELGAPGRRPRRAPAADPRGAGPPDQRHPRRTSHPLAPRPGLRPRRGQPVLRRGAARPQRGRGELPPTVRDLLLARLDALAPATRQVLRTGAVIGRTIPHDLLETVADVTGPRLDSRRCGRRSRSTSW